jgi:UrcA family protein
MSAFRTTTTMLAALTLGAIALPAYASAAAPAGEFRVDLVSTSGLDLTTAAGKAEMKTRISHAANEVCGADGTRDLSELAAIHACRVKALRDADAQVQEAVRSAEARHRNVVQVSSAAR